MILLETAPSGDEVTARINLRLNSFSHSSYINIGVKDRSKASNLLGAEEADSE